MTLYHYTCSDSAKHIDEDGFLRPWPQIQLPGRPILVWLTDMAEPDPQLLGLSMSHISCDRTAFRYEADNEIAAIPWRTWAAVHAVPYEKRVELEADRAPDQWFVWPAKVRVLGPGQPTRAGEAVPRG